MNVESIPIKSVLFAAAVYIYQQREYIVNLVLVRREISLEETYLFRIFDIVFLLL